MLCLSLTYNRWPCLSTIFPTLLFPIFQLLLLRFMPLFCAASVLRYQLLQLFFAFCFILCKFSSVALSCPTLWDPKDCSTSGFPVHHQLLELAQTRDHWVSEAFQPSHSLLSPSPPAFNLSQIRVFSNESAICIRWPKYWSFSFNISPSNEYPEQIFFKIDRLDLLSVQGTLKSLLQHHSSKASFLLHSALF